ncbi:MAG TPA: hypothetical protein VGZ02_15255 [Candidatus Baltobacteraceae bacterium]|jgi:hypothetical protein|nr:hypothetical protein [Candidatus Baltobacteraceae bacterium]
MELRKQQCRRPGAWRATLSAFVAASLAAALGAPAHRVLAQQVMPVPGYGTPLPAGTASPTPSPQVSARLGAPTTPAPSPRVQRGGPLTFALTGSLSLAQRLQSNTTDFAGFSSTSGVSQSSDSAGMLATLRRRTATTTLQLDVPVGLTLQQSSLGLLQAGYYTPNYGVEMGAQPLSLLGGAPLGQTQRGFAFVTPLSGGDLTLFDGPAFGPNQVTLKVKGVRGRMQHRGALFEFGVARGIATNGYQVDSTVIGAAKNSGALSQAVEAAFESIRGGTLPAQRSFAYQYNSSYGGNSLYGTLTLRRIGDGFVTFGSGALESDQYVDGSLRYSGGPNAVTLEDAFDTEGTGLGAVGQRRDALTFTHAFSRSNVQTAFTFEDNRVDGVSGATSWTGDAGGQVGFNFFGTSALLGAQFQRLTQQLTPASETTTYNGVLQRQFGPFALGAAYQTARQTGNGMATLQSQSEFSLTRSFGALGLGFEVTQTHNDSGQDDIEQTSPTLTLTRRLSSVATLGVTYGETRTRDVLNPLGNGHSRIFNVQLQAPFSFGNGTVQGRVNPKLPATISGTVTSIVNQQQSSSPAFSSAVGSLSNGLSNVVVVLDGTTVQRTDLGGHYQFNFVSPGPHQIHIETSSLPRGVTVDQPYASVTVLGGQAGEVDFQIGTFAAVTGHVYSRDSSGALVPLQGVALRLDDTTNATTDVLGAYGFGRLTAGVHSVQILNSSLPAMVAFSKDAQTQKVTVHNGETQTLDFKASPLGSISGYVKYAPELAPDLAGGVYNAYVVAEPGDYAAITNEDGSYELDNLPAGTYTINVDPETVPDGTGNTTGAQTIDFSGSENRQEVNFTLGKQRKQVVFTLQSTQTFQASLALSEPALPPHGVASAVLDVDANAKSVVLTVFDKKIPMVYEAARKRWAATIAVPADAPSGKTSIIADVSGLPGGQTTSASADLNVDPSIPVLSVKTSPQRFAAGDYVAVRARFLTDVRPGDTIRWLDGQITKLSQPVTGRVYEFTVKISERPMRGILLTHQGQLPITLR